MCLRFRGPAAQKAPTLEGAALVSHARESLLVAGQPLADDAKRADPRTMKYHLRTSEISWTSLGLSVVSACNSGNGTPLRHVDGGNQPLDAATPDNGGI
jgi:hypothetical protein